MSSGGREGGSSSSSHPSVSAAMETVVTHPTKAGMMAAERALVRIGRFVLMCSARFGNVGKKGPGSTGQRDEGMEEGGTEVSSARHARPPPSTVETAALYVRTFPCRSRR